MFHTFAFSNNLPATGRKCDVDTCMFSQYLAECYSYSPKSTTRRRV